MTIDTRGTTTPEPKTEPKRGGALRRFLRRALAVVIIVPIVAVALWTWLSLSISYSHGERAGVVQKFSKRGWVFKTWEGDLALVSVPGALTGTFEFTVRDDQVAAKINRFVGQHVVLVYDQHRFVPTSIFGETEYFVTDVRPAALQ